VHGCVVVGQCLCVLVCVGDSSLSGGTVSRVRLSLIRDLLPMSRPDLCCHVLDDPTQTYGRNNIELLSRPVEIF
jgi:hypothetical protein